jgi:serine-type D-Ala-D-Ala carboxypeptidase (penicillin-binding protein 5/6)
MVKLPPYARLALVALAAATAVGAIAAAFRLPAAPRASAATRPQPVPSSVPWFGMHVASGNLSFWTPAVMPVGPPPIRARAGILVDLDTGEVLWARQPNLGLPPASLTKVLTALVALDNFSPDMDVTITPDALGQAPDDTVMGLTAGETLTVSELLDGMLLPSGDDAASAMAVDTVGAPRFVAAMNAQVAALGLHDSLFSATAGLDDPDLYASAYDLAVIAAFTYDRFPLFDQMVASRSIALPANAEHHAFLLHNRDALLQEYPAAVGIKPGWTGNAGACLIGMAVRGGHRLLAVILNGNYPARLEGRLFDWGFQLEGMSPLLPPTPAPASG